MSMHLIILYLYKNYKYKTQSIIIYKEFLFKNLFIKKKQNNASYQLTIK